MYESIFEQVKRSGLEGRVHFPGFVDDADLPALYSAADLFAYVSLYEGFGLPLLEAMACGTPVIGSNTSSLPEVIGDVGLQVDPRNVDDIARALQQMIDQPELRERSIGLGLERAKLFTWDKAARELLAIYDRVGRSRAERLRESERIADMLRSLRCRSCTSRSRYASRLKYARITSSHTRRQPWAAKSSTSRTSVKTIPMRI